jgi:hypothetical protein
MHVSIHLSIHQRVHRYVHTCVRTCIHHTHILHTYLPTYTHVRTYIHTYSHIQYITRMYVSLPLPYLHLNEVQLHASQRQVSWQLVWPACQAEVSSGSMAGVPYRNHVTFLESLNCIEQACWFRRVTSFLQTTYRICCCICGVFLKDKI